MSTVKKFFVNASIMSIVSVFLRVIGVWFSVWLSRTIGEEGMGIYGLTSSVYRLGITFASGGIGFAATRIIAEEIEKKNPREALRAAEKCILFSFVTGFVTSIVFFTFSKPLGEVFLGDARCIASIKVMSISLPFLVMSSVLNAYFTGVRHLSKPAVTMLFEQGVRVSVTMLLLKDFDGTNLAYATLAVILGGVFAEIFSFLLSYLFYMRDKDCLERGKITKTPLTRRVFKIAVPVAISSYIRSGLLTVEHMMIPSGLRRHGVDASRALGIYGIISGMVFPILFFPSAFLYAASDLIVPEFAACNASNDTLRTKRLSNKVMQLTSFFSVGVAGVLFGFSHELGRVLYKSDEVGVYLKTLAPLVIIMFFDHLADAILKGLDEQVSVVKYNIIDSVISVFLVWYLVPRFGIGGYIFVVWFGEVVNAIMSTVSLVKRTGIKLRVFNWFFLPSVCIISSVLITRYLLFLFHGTLGENGFSLSVAVALSLFIYSLFMRLAGCITLHDYHLLSLVFAKKKRL